ncbi:MAG: hypothetical protein JNM18_06395 [Planctomycetaceae bacterium]|nr:hypothetical protein [Planctomycetaceae bacterium]
MKSYTDLRGTVFSLSGLESDERTLIARLKKQSERVADWTEFRNFWMAEVSQFYTAKGLSRREIIESVGYRIGQDLASRLGIAQGKMRPPDYRSDLELLILSKFQTRKEFCDATGLSEDMLSHVLARRKHLAIDTLTEALAKIGYSLHIMPNSQSNS